MSQLFQVRAENLKYLDAKKSVGLIKKLVWADATASGIGKVIINMPTAITVRDGGIDGEVGETEKDGKYGIIKKGITRYQIKSGDFALHDSGIKSILFKNNSSELKDRIKYCLDNKGTLVIIFTGWDDPDRTEEQTSNKFKEILAEVCEEYGTAKIEIWRQNTIIGLLEDFPSLRLDILGITDGSFYFHEEWSGLADMKPRVHLGAKQNKFIEDFRSVLRANDGPVHIRVIGEPGVGKTKLVLEATKADDLQSTTMYVDGPSNLEGRNFMNQISRGDDKSNLILVVDECSQDEQARIWNRLQDKSPSIKLITIFNEPDSSSGTTTRMDVPELESEEIGKIIKGYDIMDIESSKWINLCGQSPRAAHIIGQNLKNNPEDVLRSSDTVVWDRYIASSSLVDSVDFKNRRTILRWLSLFTKFGVKPQFEEVEKIAAIIENREHIPGATFWTTVNKLKEMKILQGDTTWYITPKILHIYLWTQWWKNYDSSIAPRIDELSPPEKGMGNHRLVKWYHNMFIYANQSPQARAVVKDLLKQGGFFDDNEGSRTRSDAPSFLILSKTDPPSALDYLENTIGKKSRDELSKFKSGRREVVWALEHIVTFEENFERAVKLLLLLAEAENECFSNNATGVFLSLFAPGQGKVATTEVAPKNRIPVLKRAIYSNSKYKRSIGIKACSKALETEHFSRIVHDQHEIGKQPNLWESKSEEEIIEYYQMILDILVEQLDRDDECKNESAGIILDKLESLITIPKITEKVLEITKKLKSYKVDNEVLLDKIIHLIDRKGDRLDPKILEELQGLQNNITGTDLHSLMKRYVGMDIMLDWAKDTKNHSDLRKKELDSLVSRSLDLNSLKPELKWLVTNEAKYGYVFGYKLAKKDSAYKLMPAILDELRNAGDRESGYFVGGYFSHIYENDIERWESELEKIYNDPILHRLLPEITRSSGMTDVAAERIIHGINERRFDYASLGIFRYGSMLDRLSEESFTKWIALLLEEKKDEAILIAVDLFYSYFIRGQQKTLPKQLTLKLLLHQSITHKSPKTVINVMDEFYLKEIGLAFVNQYPDDSMRIAKTVIENFYMENLFAHHNSELIRVLDEIARINPREVWKIASRYVGPPTDSRAYNIREWLRKGIMTIIPMSDIIAWINEDEKSRLGYVASFLPPKFEEIREFLVKYGDQEEVKRYSCMSFNIESWTGSETVHYEKKKKRFEELRKKETDVNVLSWLDYYIRSLDHDIKRSKDYEEREF